MYKTIYSVKTRETISQNVIDSFYTSDWERASSYFLKLHSPKHSSCIKSKSYEDGGFEMSFFVDEKYDTFVSFGNCGWIDDKGVHIDNSFIAF